MITFGGSTTESNEADIQYRFPSVVREKLIESSVDAIAINAGVRNTSHDSLIALLSRPGTEDSDYIFLMHNINDRLFLDYKNSYKTMPNDFSSIDIKI